MDEPCAVCGEPVPRELVEGLTEFSLPPICSRECAHVGAELLRVEEIATVWAYFRLEP